MPFIIGIDCGGTFTDAVLVSEGGQVTTGKAFSTPQDFSLGVVAAVEDAARNLGLSLAQALSATQLFALGTTVTTNALLTGRGARAGLITTRGFEGTILYATIQKVAGLSERELTYAVRLDRPQPIIPAPRIRGVTERMDSRGEVVVPLNMDEARQAVAELVGQDAEAIGVVFLWSFLNPSHERALAQFIRERYPNVQVTLSSELAPRIGEYTRSTTVALNCYLGGTLSRFVEGLSHRLREKGLGGPLLVMQSIGGVLPAEEAGQRAAATLASGPVGGVIGSRFLGNALGYRNIICTDVGGTSFDVGLIVDGEAQYAREPVVGQYHMNLPAVDVRSIGTGGGSIAWVEPETGLLRVGPQSAGASPGPACYQRGGTEPTLTDACLLLGYVNPDYFLGGRVPLSREAAEAAIRKVAEPMSLDTTQAAAAIYRIACSQLADLVRKLSVERGYDPRDFVVFAYGGAGPQYAAVYGAQMEVKEVVVPSLASVFSAFGIAASDVTRLYATSDPMQVRVDLHRLNGHLQALEARARADLDGRSADLLRSAELRYKGQWDVVEVPLPGGELDRAAEAEAIAHFERRYEELYGTSAGFRGAGVEFVSYSLTSVGHNPKPSLVRTQAAAGRPAPKSTRQALFPPDTAPVATPIYDMATLRAGHELLGPAIIEAVTTTVVIPPGQYGSVDEYLNVHIRARREPARA
ncbi:MAG: hydantoinase/oxoprolinase family protein [Chloroflexi bacterium]|nr:hydantoinase/oxoprolinase family protein [Chloroflexota bacterium]